MKKQKPLRDVTTKIQILVTIALFSHLRVPCKQFDLDSNEHDAMGSGIFFTLVLISDFPCIIVLHHGYSLNVV